METGEQRCGSWLSWGWRWAMFNVEVRLSVDGRYVSVQGFVEALVAEIRKVVSEGVQRPPQARPMAVEIPWREREERERKGPKPLAVGVDEAAKMLGVSSATIRRHVSCGRLRAVHVGKRVLLPMEVLEKVMVEGVAAGRRY
jgi:excisionase family DNA binding protein